MYKIVFTGLLLFELIKFRFKKGEVKWENFSRKS